ncbi:hypothetical protein RH831_01320 [Halodesulfurarchaeum sp. HSR-GB]|uniref:hypothetical protein n=1 Tax=Halodesulfurarchaeum sp. HSR-GB TaxID=3074077 RepID=UPI0028552317|nr:hypothetical protein [Halodesulfurarchaeum sp. HSR-GB]MDR5655823.1 hypothetical protein [Halodesulfurarchaeum sp. HSR-GB]
MVDEEIERVLWWWTIPELLVYLVLFFLLSASLLGYSELFDTHSRHIRLLGLVLTLFQFVAPLWVFYDLRTHSESLSRLWFHIAAMPVINLIGVVGYLEKRTRN